MITKVVDGIVTTETVDGTNDPGITTGDDGKTDAGGIETIKVIGTETTYVDGTVDGTFGDATITKVVDGIVTTETVDGTNVPGITTGDDGKTDTGGSEMV
jgi:hypothetical protein